MGTSLNSNFSIQFRALTTSRHLRKYLLTFLLITIAPATFAVAPYCNSIFFNGLITHGNEGHIDFETNAQLLGASTNFMLAAKVTSDYYANKRSCDDVFCISFHGEFIEPILIPKKETFATRDTRVRANKKVLLGKKNSTYGRIYVERGATARLTPRTGEYTIDELYLGHRSKLLLPPGEYWIGNLNLDEEGKIEIIGDGTAIVHVIDDLSVPKNFTINRSAEDAARLIIYAYGDMKFAKHSQTNAFIYSLGNTSLERKAKINGAVIAKNIYLAVNSSVSYAGEALQKMKFGNYCLGAPPTSDYIPPVIQLDPFPYNTFANSITLTGKITDPDNGPRWLAGINIFPNTNESLSLDDEGRFSIELPLNSTSNNFSIFAIDKSGNDVTENFRVWREKDIGFAIRMDAYEWQQVKPSPLSGVISVREGQELDSAVIKTVQGDIPLKLVNNRFSLYLPFKLGLNEYLVVARDNAGNEISETIYIEGLSTPLLTQVNLHGDYTKPERYITGLIYSLWPQQDFSLKIQDEPQTLIPVREGLYRFQTPTFMSRGRSRLDFVITTPDGETYAEFLDAYEPDRIFLTVDYFPELEIVETETVLVSGTLHIPLETIREKMSLVVTNDRFPGVEFPIATPTLNESGNSYFAQDIPLVLGDNILLVKVKQGNEDADHGHGVAQYEFKVVRVQ